MVLSHTDKGRVVALFDADGAAEAVSIEGRHGITVGEIEGLLRDCLDDDYLVVGEAFRVSGISVARFVRVMRREARGMEKV